jgi:hypothetical protein
MDGFDNDGDGLIDYPEDPGCASMQDNDEYNVPPDPCGNGICEPHLGEDPAICPSDCEPGPVDM